jgi:uncharacterized protein
LTDLAADENIIEYGGEVIPWAEAQARYEHSDAVAGHTFFFDLGDGSVIDGGRGGNSARWLNHGCEPNCEAVQYADKIVIRAGRPITAGEELLIDYHLAVEGRSNAATRALYTCRCGAPSCCGTMLATRRATVDKP